MTFVWPQALFGLVVIPVLVWIYIRRLRARKAAGAELGVLAWVDAFGRRRHVPPAVMLTGLGLLLFGLARPQTYVSLPHAEGTVILAFDVSNSMSADDVLPTRLEAAKAAGRTFIQHQPPTIRMGVVAFGGNALIMQSPTNVQSDALAAIDRLGTQGGTSLGAGIFAGLNAIAGKALSIEQATTPDGAQQLRVDSHTSAVIVLLTDGEDTQGQDPLEIAQLAADAGVRIFPVGIGSPTGANIQVDGFNIHTQLDESTLQAIADETNGTYYPAADAQSLDDIYHQVDIQLTTRGQQMEITSLVGGLSGVFLLMGGALALIWFGRVP
jgi:Ca-activated chloride channel family protein